MRGSWSLLAAAAAAAAVAAAPFTAATKTLTPTQMEGPFFLDLRTLRRDVTNGRPGVPLYLQLRVEGGCKPGGYGCKRLPDALVDVWHTDSRGIYSGFSDRGVNATGRDWMRGTQVTRKDGMITFRTIVPGWYPGRLAHLHVKVRLAVPPANRGHVGCLPYRPPMGFTTQLYLPDALVRSIYAVPPYNSVDTYVSDIDQDVVLEGDAAEYAALTMAVWPATAAWCTANGFTSGSPWGMGHVATYTLRLQS